MNSKSTPKDEQPKDERHSPPSLSLPKGGGAIKGIGEKFAANPVTGTGSLTIPLPLSPGRSAFTPALTLSYDSGAGNGPFGFGWSIGFPTITRRTDKGLPQYLDSEESDVFILSGAEDLVPVLNDDGSRFETQREAYRVTRYRPRIEGLFARIERWTSLTDPADTFWRSISPDNVTTFYGKTTESRIFDPTDPTRIFSWLICQSYDDKGNAVLYEYQKENSEGISESQVQEKNRTPAGRQANRYLKRVKYGNRKANRNETTWEATDPSELPSETWMFELVFDYDEGHYTLESPESVLAGINKTHNWTTRPDIFSTYRAGFEVRTYRLCRRVLMFHHFPGDLQTPDYLVRSTEFTYDSSPIASFITEVTQSGYTRRPDGAYLKRSFPPLSLEYSKAVIRDEIETVDPESLENLPAGAGVGQYEWLDLDGEGLQGILSEQTDGWYYKRNESPIATTTRNGEEIVVARLAPVAEVATLPSMGEATGGRHQFLDLAGDGNLDLVQFEKPTSGFFERSDEERWKTFVPFNSLPNVFWSDPNLRFIDLTGDGHADILITEDHALTWYPALGEDGFGRAMRLPVTLDEEQGPAVVFADGTQAIVTADLSGDGLTDIVRIRNGEVCYWPNLGYGRFGAKVTMDNSPWFDAPDQFDQKRIRLADIDGSGTTDVIYFERDRVAIYRNECGNSWAAAEYLESFPPVDDLSSANAMDLLGIGTACLVWSSPLPGNAQRQMRYIDLMGRQKPHLLTHCSNNLGAETVVEYAPSTKFYLSDKLEGKPWITRLPFPVHVVERVETRDLISRNRFVTRYQYHHGYYDGFEREFRGFGMVEQFDTEEIGALNESPNFPNTTNIDAASYVPPVLTKTWFHSGAFLEGERISRQFEDEYYRESGLSDEQREAMLLRDTELPATLLTTEELREAHRALKGSVLRQEVYALDGTEEEKRPYSVSEQNYTIELLQPEFENRHAVFFVHPREAIQFHYERKLADPRVVHQMTLEVDAFGNALKSAAIAYGRRHDDLSSLLTPGDREKQSRIHVTCNENAFTNPIDAPDAYRKPLPSETRTFEVIELPELKPAANQPDVTNLFRFDEMLSKIESASDGQHDLAYENFKAEGIQQNEPCRRLIEHVRTLYRRDDLTALLPLGQVHSLALTGEGYKLAFTPGLLSSVYKRGTENLLADVPAVLGNKGTDGGGYIRSDDLKAENLFPAADPNDHWWIPSGRAFFSLSAPQELTEARRHFFLPRKFVDPFEKEATVEYDAHDLLVSRTTDAMNNRVQAQSDYRVLQPKLITDPNGNQTRVAFDALGMVAATAVIGKNNDKGDLLDDSFQPDPAISELRSFVEAPREPSANPDESVPSQIARDLLGSVTTRIVYDLDRFRDSGKPPFAATLARETHFRDTGGEQPKIQISFSYSDGFGREIQKKIQAEPGPVVDGGPDVNPRWVSSGWTIFNNKGKPVRQYEPFFTATHDFEFARSVGVSPVLFYDPVGRVVATLHPNHTWEKVVFDPWQQTTYDVNDTVTIDPRIDEDVKDFFTRLPDEVYLPTWFGLRTDPQFTDESEKVAAQKAAKHADTPSVAYLDSLGRTFLTIAHNKFEREQATIEEKYATRVELDIEGNQREVIDARDRVVMRYDYDMLGSQIHQSSMEAGERWMLNDVVGRAIRAWDSRGHEFRTEYDRLRRPKRSFVTGVEPDGEICFGVNVYGEEATHASADLNLRGQLLLQCDSAGIVVSEEHDFKGNLLQTSRRVAREYKRSINWNSVNWNAVEAVLTANPFELEDLLEPFETLLEQEEFASSSTYDALNRPVTATAPDNSIYRPTFNEANLLEKVDVKLRGETETAFVTDIDHDAKGQRTLIRYGNNAATTYEYDKLTFRLKRLNTTRPADPDNFASEIFNNASTVQDLHYTYDPVGNITRIEDRALRTVFSHGSIEATCNYIYDATYRLIEAKGREHIGQTAHDFNPSNRRDFDFVGFAHPNDTQALRNYTESYEYDEVGNFKSTHHEAINGSWTRTYEYQHDSLLDALQKSNRLTQTTVGNNPPEKYTYTDSLGKDVHGCMTSINNMAMEWNFRDQLQQVDLGGGGTAFYVYDSNSQRARKVIENQNGRRQKERIYAGGFEVYREFDTNDSTIKLERETLHVMDDQQRIALVETETTGNSQPVIRYQLGNHLSSASVELDRDAQVISYEEYHPYGTTSFQVGLIKQYRFTGMERDEETGFTYHGARYYSPWISRWISCDPMSIADGPNHYCYVSSNPITLLDPTGTDGRTKESHEYARAVRQGKQADARLAAFLKTKEGAAAAATEARLKAAKAALAQAERERADKQLDLEIAKNWLRIKAAKADSALADYHEASSRAAESAQRAHTGFRIVGGIKFFWSTVAAAGSCAAAETGIGAAGCVYFLDSARSGWNEAWSGEPSPTATQQTLTEGAKLAGFSNSTANKIGTYGDMVVGGVLGAVSLKGTYQPGISASKTSLSAADETFATFDEAFKAAEAGRAAGRDPHILQVLVYEKHGGKLLGEWWEVSGQGQLLGHTEQKALSRIKLKSGMEIEMRGWWGPCNRKGGCANTMDYVATKYNVDIVYRSKYGSSFYAAGEGHIPEFFEGALDNVCRKPTAR